MDERQSPMRWRRHALAALATFTVLVGSLPSVANAQQEDRASVRVIHGVSDAGPIDVYIDGAIAVVGATFPSVTDPLTVAGGEHRVVVVPSGSGVDAAFVDSTLTVAAGTTDEIAVVGTAASPNAVLFEVDRSPLPADVARLRIVHASPDADPVQPTLVGSAVLFPTIEYLLATEYAEVPAGVYPIEFAFTSGVAEPVSVADLELAAGTVTDIYLVGQVADQSFQPLVVGARTRRGDRAAAGQVAPTPEAAQAGEAAPADEQVRTASLLAGSCDALGAEVSPIAPVAAPTGAEVGPQGGAAIRNGFATIPVAFDAIVAAEHSIAIGAAACGEVGGRLTDDGGLAVPLLAANGTARGVAFLGPNALDPTATDISVFLVPGRTPADAPTGEETAAAADAAATPAAVGGQDQAPVTVTIEAIGTPAP